VLAAVQARERLRAADWLTLSIGAGLTAITFVTTGGVDLAPNTLTEIALVFVGAALVAAAAVTRPAGRLWGGTAVVLFAALTALTLASISWSVQPSDSWIEANRTLSYLAAFAGAVALARIAPARWASIVVAIAIAATAVCGYALLVKVFPASLDPQEFLGRLRAPFTYWNAVGLMAALGLPPCVWAGAQRDQGGLLRALAVPAIAVLVIALVLCYSRGALLVTLIGLAVWFATVPLRLRGAVVLALGGACGAVGTAWALATHPITVDRTSLASRTSAGHAFGLLLVVLLVLATVGGVAGLYAMDRFAPGQAIRRRIGTALVVLVACVPLAGLGALAASSRGFTGEISHLWSTVTSTHSSGVNDNAGRLVQISNSRARYWREGLKVGEHHLLAGAGALGYATARLAYTTDSVVNSQHAHSYAVETFADFGLLGVGLSLALLAAWGMAAGRTVGVRRIMLAEHGAERAGLLTLLAVVVTFGAHSMIDWTWFIPGVAVPALLCAGWLAGRGPLLDRGVRGPMLAGPAAIAAGSLVAALALVCGWMIWQPLRSADADQASLTALSSGHTDAAVRDARTAIARNPLSAEPLWDLATIYASSGHTGRAHGTLVRAVRLQPSNPATWLQLGEFDLSSNRPREALPVLQAALYLGPYQPETLSAIAQASSELQTRAAAPTPSAAAKPSHHRTRTRTR
jgi:hypothetical protein